MEETLHTPRPSLRCTAVSPYGARVSKQRSRPRTGARARVPRRYGVAVLRRSYGDILLPLVLPGLITTGVFSFITAWNDFLYANVIMQQQDRWTLSVWMFGFQTNTGTDYGGLMAASTIFALPVVIFFLLVQKRIVSGLTAGAVKG